MCRIAQATVHNKDLIHRSGGMITARRGSAARNGRKALAYRPFRSVDWQSAPFETCRIPPAGRPTDLDRNQGLHDYVFDLSRRHRSDVAGCFLSELDAGCQAEFGVDVSQVGLHGSR